MPTNDRGLETATEAGLGESAAIYPLVVESMGEVILMVDAESTILFASRAVEGLFGYSPGELIGGPLEVLIPERYREAHRAGMARYLATAERRLAWTGAELPGLHKSGREIPMEIAFAEHSLQGRPVFTGVVRDITERRSAEAVLRQSEERFRVLAENIEDVFYLAEGEVQRVLYVSPAYEKIWGRSREALYADPLDWIRVIHPDDRDRVLTSLPGRIDGLTVQEYRIERSDGSVRWIRDRAFPLPGPPDEVHRYTGIAQDITEERRDQERYRFLARANGVFLASALDTATLLPRLTELAVPVLGDFCLVDLIEEGTIRRVAAAHADPRLAPLVDGLLRYPPRPDAAMGPAEAIRAGKSILVHEVTPTLVADAARDPEHRRIVEALAPRAILTVPLRARDHTLGAITFARSSPGRPFEEFDRILAEELASHAALAIDNARLYEAVQHAARARQEILRTVSHELRTPLHAVTLIGETLRQSLPSSIRAADSERLTTIGQLTERMTRMVDDLLDVTLLEAGQFRVQANPEPVQRLLAEAVQSVDPIARDAGLQLSLRAAGSLPWVLADRQRTVQVATNLLTNAIRVTPRGGAIGVEAVEVDGEVRVSVSDQGPGIPPAELRHLFDRFWRGSTASGSGIGLGLPIAKGIIEAQGGRIWAEDRHDQGRGAVFHFTISALRSGSTQSAPSEGAPGAPPLAPDREVAGTNDGGVPRYPEGAGARLGRHRASRDHPRPVSDDVALVADDLRRRILARVYTGELQPGDRLPSIREVARLTNASKRAAAAAYTLLEHERVIESRARSGIYLIDPEPSVTDLPSETAEWMVEVLAEASNHQIRFPYLPELFRRWTSAVPLRCACVESDVDSIATLRGELEHRFGLEPVGIDAATLAAAPLPGAADTSRRLPPEIAGSDLFVTTPFHASLVRRWADALDKPLVIATLHPEVTATVRRHLERSDLTVVCAGPSYGERLRLLFGEPGVGRIRVLCLPDPPQLETLPVGERVLLTWAARERLGHVDLPLLVPVSPAFSPEFTRDLSRVVIRLNLRLGRK